MMTIGEVFPGKTRILVVDDDSDLRLTLCEYLESRNFLVSSARNGSEAVALLKSGKVIFDIIFTDLIMPPGPDGLEVLKVAKDLNLFCHVVVMTGYSSIETAIDSRLERIESLLSRIIANMGEKSKTLTPLVF